MRIDNSNAIFSILVPTVVLTYSCANGQLIIVNGL